MYIYQRRRFRNKISGISAIERDHLFQMRYAANRPGTVKKKNESETWLSEQVQSSFDP